MVLCNHPDMDYKKACFDAYNRWIAEYCGKHPRRLLGCGQTAMRSPEEGIEDLKSIQSLGLRGVMMPGNPGARGLRLAALRPVLGGGHRARPAALLPHPHRPQLRLRPSGARPGHERLPRHRARLPGHHGHPRARRRVRAAPRAAHRVRRGRRRLGAPLHVPDGPRLQAPPQLAARRPGALEAPVGVLPREHLHDVPGRLGGVPRRRPDELAPPAAGRTTSPTATRPGPTARRCSPSTRAT